LGYETIDHNNGHIPYGIKEPTENYSIYQLELKTALKEGMRVYIFIKDNVLTEYETYSLNKINPKTLYKYADDKRIYEFIEEIKSLSQNNNIKRL